MKFICYGKCIKLYVEKMDRDKYLWKNIIIFVYFLYIVVIYI